MSIFTIEETTKESTDSNRNQSENNCLRRWISSETIKLHLPRCHSSPFLRFKIIFIMNSFSPTHLINRQQTSATYSFKATPVIYSPVYKQFFHSKLLFNSIQLNLWRWPREMLLLILLLRELACLIWTRGWPWPSAVLMVMHTLLTNQCIM